MSIRTMTTVALAAVLTALSLVFAAPAGAKMQSTKIGRHLCETAPLRAGW